jgi:hypothetical protein
LKALYEELEEFESIILDSLVILLDISDNDSLIREKVYKTSSKLYQLIRDMPYSEEKISTFLGDARQIPLEEDQINFCDHFSSIHQCFQLSSKLSKFRRVIRMELTQNCKI